MAAFNLSGVSPLPKFDFQATAEAPTVAEVCPLERVAEVISEELVSQIQNIELRRAKDSLFFEEIDARRKVKKGTRFNPPTRKIDKFRARRRVQLGKAVFIYFQWHAAFVPAGQTEQ
jgi:hypothetical protein